jgi:hypothetical protein
MPFLLTHIIAKNKAACKGKIFQVCASRMGVAVRQMWL